MRLKTLFHDMKPANVGKNGIIFDPAIDPVTKAVGYAGGAVGVGGGLCINYCGEE